jgi:hypothetical protein
MKRRCDIFRCDKGRNDIASQRQCYWAFIVPTVTHKVLFVPLILAHERRRLGHFKITEHPTAEWTAQPMIGRLPVGQHTTVPPARP